MFKTYLVIALRRFSRERVYATISILSLALGIASFLILALYVHSEWNYDGYNVNRDRTYRLISRFTNPGNPPRNFALTPNGLGPLLTRDYPQLGTYARLRPANPQGGPVLLGYQGIREYWDRVFLADATVFQVFTHRILYGDPATAFRSPYSIALSETVAKRYFGDTNPIGRIIAGPLFTLTVTLVFADQPEGTHLKYDALLPMTLDLVFNKDPWGTYQQMLWEATDYTYLMVPPGVTREDLDRLTKRFVESHMGARAAQLNMRYAVDFQPLTAVHWGEKLEQDQPTGNIFYVYGFAAVGVFILLIGCINYTNLATARAMQRAKEIGMRKVLGSNRSQLVAQFLAESGVFTAIALVIAAILVYLLLAFGQIGVLMGKQRLLEECRDPRVLGATLLLGMFVAIASGLYPALSLSAVSPLAALTHLRRSWKVGLSVRQTLVFAQLSLSIAVIACTILMADQMRYVHDKPLGFEKKNQLVLTWRGHDLLKNMTTLKAELRKLPNILDVTNISIVPGTGSTPYGASLENDAGTMGIVQVDRMLVGTGFIEALQMRLVEGREFSPAIVTDSDSAVMVNESLVRKMGWTDPLGKRVSTDFGGVARVIGVVGDFNYASLHNPIGPLVIFPLSDLGNNVPDMMKDLVTVSVIVTMTGENVSETLRNIKSVIARFDPTFTYEPVFLEDRLRQLYEGEAHLTALIGIFSGICIVISIMGLFGLTAFTIEERSKEIGIRKVVGASAEQIIALLSRPLLVLIVAAAVPASIVSYEAMDRWIQRFAYHDSITWVTFAESILVVMLVTLAAVALQAWRSARAEPAEAIRHE
jgi:putative ABC transport system permease protein